MLRLIGWAWVTVLINVVTHTNRKYNFLIVHLSFEKTIRLCYDQWFISGNWGQAGNYQLKDLWGGAASKVEALYDANVKLVVNG